MGCALIQLCLLILTSLLYSSANASESYGSFQGCGSYKIAGVIRKDPDTALVLVVNEKTASEYRFKPAPGELPSFASYLDTPIHLNVDVIQSEGHRGVVSHPSELNPRAPDPIHPHLNSGFALLKKRKCEK